MIAYIIIAAAVIAVIAVVVVRRKEITTSERIYRTFRSQGDADVFFDAIGAFVQESNGTKSYPQVIDQESASDGFIAYIEVPDGMSEDEFARLVHRKPDIFGKDSEADVNEHNGQLALRILVDESASN